MQLLNRSLAYAVVAVVALAAVAESGVAAPTKLTIVHFNDLDRMEERGGRGGVARLGTVIKTEREQADNLLVTFGGDAISPSLLSAFDKGAHMIDLLNRLGLSAMALGNHEFDFGPAVTRQRISEATFPVLGANSRDEDGEIIDGARESIMVGVNGFKIGIFGLTTVGTAVKSKPGNVAFLPVVDVAAQQARILRDAGAHLVVALAHTDADEDAALLAQGAIDMLLSGDDHFLRIHYDGKVLFAESGEQANRVIVIELDLDWSEKRGRRRFVWSPAFRVIDTANVAPDPELAAATDVYLHRLSQELDIKIGSTRTELDSRRVTVRSGEAAIGNLIADAMRLAVNADAALTNGGGIRANRIYAPDTVLTRRDVLSELPFGNKTIVIEVTGREVVAALEHGLAAIGTGSGRFPHISGLEVTYDPGKPPGSRVITVVRNGRHLDPDQTLALATNDFLGSSGDGYQMFKDKRRIIDAYAGTLVATQVIRHITARGTVAPRVDGRLRAVNR